MSGLIAVALFASVVASTDWRSFVAMVGSLSWVWLAAATGCFVLEGLAAAARIQMFTPGDNRYSTCLRVNAWYVLALIGLPARLGEVAGVFLFKKYLAQASGPAAVNVIAQRLMDVAVLGTAFFISGLFLSRIAGDGLVAVIVLLVVGASVAGLRYLPQLLAIIARLMLHFFGRRQLMAVLRALLGARIWYRRRITLGRLIRGIAATLVRWLANFAGLVCILTAMELQLSGPELWVAAVSYNLLNIVPLHTVGGIGITDAGIAALLVWYGVPVATAAAASLLIRGAIIAFIVIFCGTILLLSRPSSRVT
jgi:uncharacterized membrane protein YbhN (UPF0104 family)